jgi:hypothetical protein
MAQPLSFSAKYLEEAMDFIKNIEANPEFQSEKGVDFRLNGVVYQWVHAKYLDSIEYVGKYTAPSKL